MDQVASQEEATEEALQQALEEPTEEAPQEMTDPRPRDVYSSYIPPFFPINPATLLKSPILLTFASFFFFFLMSTVHILRAP